MNTPQQYLTPRALALALIPLLSTGDLNITTEVDNQLHVTYVTIFSHGYKIGTLELLAPMFPNFGCVEAGSDDEYDQSEDFEGTFRFDDLGWIDTKHFVR